mmetsp:Transcript_25524/g.58941  ORF Transcript_25524/g.58941 Transcript_25524/m.58941 type:complete len:226 (+) Transcript_25524:51-728(+)
METTLDGPRSCKKHYHDAMQCLVRRQAVCTVLTLKTRAAAEASEKVHDKVSNSVGSISAEPVIIPTHLGSPLPIIFCVNYVKILCNIIFTTIAHRISSISLPSPISSDFTRRYVSVCASCRTPQAIVKRHWCGSFCGRPLSTITGFSSHHCGQGSSASQGCDSSTTSCNLRSSAPPTLCVGAIPGKWRNNRSFVVVVVSSSVCCFHSQDLSLIFVSGGIAHAGVN